MTMIDLGPHAVFIVWAYAGVAVAVVALIAWIVFDAPPRRERLAALEAQGIRRRSGPRDPRFDPHRSSLSSCRWCCWSALVAVFAVSLDRDPGLVRSVLIDKPAPATTLPAARRLRRPRLRSRRPSRAR